MFTSPCIAVSARAISASESIPTRRRLAITALKEQSEWLSFPTSSPSPEVQVDDRTETYMNVRSVSTPVTAYGHLTISSQLFHAE